MIEKSKGIQVDNISSLVRLIISFNQSRGGHIYCTKKDNETYFFAINLVAPWHNLRGLPVTFYAKSERYYEENFISYNANNVEKEEINFVSTIQDSSKIHLPIIKLKELPEFLL